MILTSVREIIMEPSQTSVIAALQSMLNASGLILACPHCLRERGHSHVRGDVYVTHPRWNLTCDCANRIMERRHARHPYDADGELMASAQTVLEPVRLTVRCPESSCLRHPLEMERTQTHLVVRCRCAKTRFPFLSQIVH